MFKWLIELGISDKRLFAGDRGFDPLGLAKPTEYLQIDVDALDQNAAVNKAGEIVGAFVGDRNEKVSAKDALAPYDEVRLGPTTLNTRSALLMYAMTASRCTKQIDLAVRSVCVRQVASGCAVVPHCCPHSRLLTPRRAPQVFGIERFRECELIHGRWAMLACLGCIWAELQTGVSWVDAGKVELDGAQYFNFSLPFTITQLVWIEVRLASSDTRTSTRAANACHHCYYMLFLRFQQLAHSAIHGQFQLVQQQHDP